MYPSWPWRLSFSNISKYAWASSSLQSLINPTGLIQAYLEEAKSCFPVIHHCDFCFSHISLLSGSWAPPSHCHWSQVCLWLPSLPLTPKFALQRPSLLASTRYSIAPHYWLIFMEDEVFVTTFQEVIGLLMSCCAVSPTSSSLFYLFPTV